MNRISFTKPYIDDDIINSVVESLRSGWITTGPKVMQLEQKICELFNVKNCLCLNSWTNSAETVLKWFDVKEGDEVIVPVLTYCATANIVLHCGAKVVMVDINNDMNINVDKIKDAITQRTKVIMPVDISGLSCNYNKIIEIINMEEIKNKFIPSSENQHKLGRILLLSDAAHSIGAKLNEKYACNYSDFTVFSFHAVKNITTAEGGAVCFNLPEPFNNEDVYKFFKIFTLHGQTKTAMDKYSSTASKYDYWKYDILMPGYKCNMPDILACIGLEQLKKFDKLMNIRRNICKRYYENLKKYNFIIFPVKEEDLEYSSCHLLCIQIKDFIEQERDKLINHLSDLNIAMNVHFKPLPLLTAYKNLGYNIEEFNCSNNIYKNVISLPLHYDLTEQEIDYVCNSIVDVIHDIINN
jgi:dTDP-4-amino-4,6-dideoxygalactose transaminase